MSDNEKTNFSLINCEEKLNAFIKEKYPDVTKNGHTRLSQDMAEYFKKSTDPTHRGIRATNLPDIIKSNFNNGIKGKKPLPIHFVLAIEMATKKSFYDILFGEKTEEAEEDTSRFLLTAEYAAYKDDPIIYRKLMDKRDAVGTNSLSFIDEFDHTILDYITQNFKANGRGRNGIRLFIEEKDFTSGNLKGYFFDSDDDHNLPVIWEMILDEDDTELFFKFASSDSPIDYHVGYYKNNEIKTAIINSIFKTKNIYSRLLQPFESEHGLPCFSQMTLSLLKFAVETENSAEIERIANAYKKFVDEMIETEQRTRVDVGSNYQANTFGSITTVSRCTENHRNEEPLFELWEIHDYYGYNKELAKLFPDHTWESVYKRLAYKTADDLKDGESWTDTNKGITYYKFKEPPHWIELYLEGAKHGDNNPFPHCEKLENDVYQIEYVNHFEEPRIAPEYLIKYLRMLGKAHTISAEMLGNGNVYTPNQYRYSYSKNRQTNYIDGWNQSPESSALYAVTDVLLDFLRCNNPELVKTLRGYTTSYQTIFKAISTAVSAYGRPEVTEGFGDKFYSELDNRIKDYIKSKSSCPNDEYTTLNHALGFARLYQEELNNIFLK